MLINFLFLLLLCLLLEGSQLRTQMGGGKIIFHPLYLNLNLTIVKKKTNLNRVIHSNINKAQPWMAVKPE